MDQNKTAEFIIHEALWNKASLELHDVQPLFGGVTVLLPGWTSSEARVGRVAPGGSETKYRLSLKWTEKEKEQLIWLCVENDFLTIQPAQRPGIPDEARPTLTLRNSKHESHTVAKWAGVADARFDAIYQAMLALAERTAGLKPIPPRFSPWQKAGIVAALAVSVLLLPLPGYAAARAVVTLWWPERVGLLLVLLLHLLVFLLAGMAGLSWWERRKPRWDRVWTHPWMLIGVNLCFFLAGIGAWGLAETAVATWRSDLLLTAGDERVWYVLLGYAGVFTAVLLLALADPLLPRLLTLIDERF